MGRGCGGGRRESGKGTGGREGGRIKVRRDKVRKGGWTGEGKGREKSNVGRDRGRER